MPSFSDIVRTIGRVLGAATAAGFVRYLVFLVWYKIQQNKRKLPLAPGPTPLPVLGSLLDIAAKSGPDGNPLVHIALMEMGQKYDGLFGLYLGAGYTVVITKPSVAEEAYCDHKLANGEQGKGNNTTDRASGQTYGGHHVPSMYIMTRDGKGIAMSTGAYWRKVRGRLVAHITNEKVALKNAPMIMEEVNSVCWAWRERVKKGEDLVDLTGQLKRESMNMAMRLLFSTRFGSELPEDYKVLQHCVEYCFCNLSAGNPSDMIPALRVLPNKFLKEFEDTIAERDRVLGRIIDTHRKEWDALRAEGKMSKPSEARDILDLFFFDQVDGFEVITNGVSTIQKLTEDQVDICIWDILFASTDTTATTNEWMVYHMINNPDIQAKVHEELDRVVGPDRQPTMEDKEKLPYFWAFIKEVFRYKIVSPVMAPHYAVDDMTLHDAKGKEFFVPAGTCIFMHGYSMALDEELWDEPNLFKPERWLSAREEGLDLYGQVKRKTTEHYKFMPFSIGPRMCPGYSFAKVAQFLQSATLAHNFRYKLSAKAQGHPKVKSGKLDLQETWGLTIMPQRYGEMGLVAAELRPAARLCYPLFNDLDRSKAFLNREEQKVALIAREQLSHDTAVLRFRLGPKTSGMGPVLGLPVGKHVKVIMPNLTGAEQGKWNGRDDPEAGKPHVERAYTPVSNDDAAGYVDLLVKMYDAKVVERFPDGGKVSQQLGKLQLGDQITLRGPFGLVEYLGKSAFKLGRETVTKRLVGMVAGGSGITPMLQILVASLEDAADQTKFSLIYANQTEPDILCRHQLEDLEARFPKRFKLHYTLDRPPAGWKYSEGFVSQAMLAEHMPPKSPDTIILACGPPPMVEHAVKANLLKLGYEKDHLAVF